ncbi:MAG: hypothetical protein US58_C0030G0009 [Candidatus Magasanikbacteria bacterium GW2011_GWA2_37_8]|uniref:Uncharacterized protein n=1 Tax=Candidatus Magasanikbacteria bacterium GW2011_GWA2_37_8 TaxID=1619036 RepID=A0A0G0H8V5_9BACT|nr:MAG: hypothetical protein US58_C0030G0009 [Candidatus Magasanikbacteria bacterium GW2011_GWA2_37_8]
MCNNLGQTDGKDAFARSSPRGTGEESVRHHRARQGRHRVVRKDQLHLRSPARHAVLASQDSSGYKRAREGGAQALNGRILRPTSCCHWMPQLVLLSNLEIRTRRIYWHPVKITKYLKWYFVL